jgi:hypothetical protein
VMVGVLGLSHCFDVRLARHVITYNFSLDGRNAP